MLRAFSSIFDGQSAIILDENESHHIACVLRAKKGADIEILNGRGLIGSGRITSPDKKATKVEILKTEHILPADVEITLLHATLTNSHTDFVIREATAIGVQNIWVFQSEHSESKIATKLNSKLEHWKKLSIEACKQSGNPYLPNIYFAPKLENIELPKQDVLCLFGHIDATSCPISTYLESTGTKNKIVIGIGPEGDFSEKEKDYLLSKNFRGCTLGKNILRAETATIYALSVINNYLEAKNAK